MQIGFIILKMVCVLVGIIGEISGSTSNQLLRMFRVRVETNDFIENSVLLKSCLLFQFSDGSFPTTRIGRIDCKVKSDKH